MSCLLEMLKTRNNNYITLREKKKKKGVHTQEYARFTLTKKVYERKIIYLVFSYFHLSFDDDYINLNADSLFIRKIRAKSKLLVQNS